MITKLPEDWGKEPLSEFIEAAHRNCIASFVNYRELRVMKALKEVDALFRCVLGIRYKEVKEILLPGFVGRSHSAYLGSIQLSTAGQAAEAYPVIRLCLENALYALFIQDDPAIDKEIPERLQIWADRGTNDEATKKCRHTFGYGNIRDHLVGRDSALGEETNALYERTVVYGAHPNFYAHATTSDPLKSEGGEVQYLLPDTDAAKLAIQTAVHAGMCSLRIFGLILRDRFEEAGIPGRLRKIDWRS